MNKKSLLYALLGLVVGASGATWAVSGQLSHKYTSLVNECQEKNAAVEKKLADYCSGQPVGPNVRITQVTCGDQIELCMCGIPRQ
jgi:hypothetical protein